MCTIKEKIENNLLVHEKGTINVSSNTNVHMSICISLSEWEWLSDYSIQTYYELLMKVTVECVYLVNHSAIIHAIKCLNEIDDVVVPLKLNQKPFIIFPLSDSPIVDQVWGTYWSLLWNVNSLDKYFRFISVIIII